MLSYEISRVAVEALNHAREARAAGSVAVETAVKSRRGSPTAATPALQRFRAWELVGSTRVLAFQSASFARRLHFPRSTLQRATLLVTHTLLRQLEQV